MIFALFCLLLLQTLWTQSRPATETIPYSEFQIYLKGCRVAQIQISSDQIEGTFKEPLANGTRRFVTNRVEPGLAPSFVAKCEVFE
jgi:cell division protease FtsH